MARTIRIKLYKFNELSDSAKQKAIDDYRNSGNVDTQYIYDEAHDSVKEFHDIFGTREGNRSWLEVRFDYVDNNIRDLKGLRLRTYIINNFYNSLYKNKYRKSWQTDKPVKHRKVTSQLISKETGWTNKELYGKYWNKYRDLNKDNSCVLTGMAYDDDLLAPIYEFIEWKDDYSDVDFETLITDCIQSLTKILDDESDYQNSDEAITENIIANDYEFTKEGKQHY